MFECVVFGQHIEFRKSPTSLNLHTWPTKDQFVPIISTQWMLFLVRLVQARTSNHIRHECTSSIESHFVFILFRSRILIWLFFSLQKFISHFFSVWLSLSLMVMVFRKYWNKLSMHITITTIKRRIIVRAHEAHGSIGRERNIWPDRR